MNVNKAELDPELKQLMEEARIAGEAFAALSHPPINDEVYKEVAAEIFGPADITEI